VNRPLALSFTLALVLTLAFGSGSHGRPYARLDEPAGSSSQGQDRRSQTGNKPPATSTQGQAGVGSGQEKTDQGQWQVRRIQGLWHAFQPGSQVAAFTWIDSASQNSGVTLAPVDAGLRAHLKLPENQGLIVTDLETGSPAAAAGILQNDVLLRLYNDPNRPSILSKPADLEAGLKKAEDKPIFLQLLRAGKTITLRVQPRVRVGFGPVRTQPVAYWIGVSAVPLESALRAQLQIPDEQGLITVQVFPDSPASKAGLKTYDVLLKLDGADLVSREGLSNVVQSRGEKNLTLELLREGRKQEVKITPERRKAGSLPAPPMETPKAAEWRVVHPGAVVSSGGDLSTQELSFAVQDLNRLTLGEAPVKPQDSTAKRLDELSAQIKELRQAIEALAKAQGKK
jgi:membrane-associated protease RseP (regulator of RpoE activity)